MAAKKQNPKPAAAADTAPPAGAGSRKAIIIFGVALVLAIGASVGGTLYFLGGGEAEAQAEEGATREHAQALYHSLQPPFVVNYEVAGKPRYLQTDLALLARDEEVIAGVTAHAPLIRASLLEALSGQNFLDLQSQEGKQALQAALLAKVNEVLKSQTVGGEAEQVLFSSFVMQ